MNTSDLPITKQLEKLMQEDSTLKAAAEEGITFLETSPQTITYKSFRRRLRDWNEVPIHWDTKFFHLLGCISLLSDRKSGYLLSTLVVSEGTKRPGRGYFEYARELGRLGSDEEIWRGELAKIRESRRKGKGRALRDQAI